MKGKHTVRFDDNIIVHYIDNNNEDRNGYCWIIFVGDRARFKRRIEKSEEILKKCLEAKLYIIQKKEILTK
jgi:hypothetical protein